MTGTALINEGSTRGPLPLATRIARRHVGALRDRNPAATPAQLMHVLGKRYLLAMSLAGTGTGLASLTTTRLAPLLGLSAAHLGASGTTSVIYLACVAELYGLDDAGTRTLVSACARAQVGPGVLEQQFNGTWWRSALAYLPASQVRFTNAIAARSLERTARRREISRTAKALPAGIGATLGVRAGRLLGNRIIDAATDVLGPPPRAFPR